MTSAIEVNGLTKSFGDVLAVDHVVLVGYTATALVLALRITLERDVL